MWRYATASRRRDGRARTATSSGPDPSPPGTRRPRRSTPPPPSGTGTPSCGSLRGTARTAGAVVGSHVPPPADGQIAPDVGPSPSRDAPQVLGLRFGHAPDPPPILVMHL